MFNVLRKLANSTEVKVLNGIVSVVGGAAYSVNYFHHRTVVQSFEDKQMRLIRVRKRIDASNAPHDFQKRKVEELTAFAENLDADLLSGTDEYTYSRQKIDNMLFCNESWSDNVNRVAPMLGIGVWMRGMIEFPVLFVPWFALLLFERRSAST